jgi:3-oxosteroid 1-dehydrogenase
MGNDYAGPGATIGPSMTFGYVSVRHMVGDFGGAVAEEQPAAATPES